MNITLIFAGTLIFGSAVGLGIVFWYLREP